MPEKLKVTFPNLRSRLIIGRMFERQFIVPETPPKLFEGFLKWYERKILRVDVSDIRIDRPVFLIGLPRSGTSMLQDLICMHPDLAYITNAMHQFRTCFCAVEVLRKWLKLDAKGERYLGDSVEVEAGSPNDAVGFWGEWLKWDLYSLDYVPRRLADYTQQEVDDIKLAIRKIIWCFGNKNGRFFSKNPGLVPEILLLKEMFPDAKFVHIVRDARMCANSMRKLYRLEQEQLERIKAHRRHGLYDEKPFVPYPRTPHLAEYSEQYGVDNIRTTAHLWNEAVQFVRDHKDELPNFHEVRYEDILENPKQEIFNILEFCELPPIREDNTAFWDKLGEVGVLHHSNKYGDFDVIEEICKEQMEHYRYL